MITQEQYNELVQKVGTDAADKIKTEVAASEKRINDAHAEQLKGLIPKTDFEAYKAEQLEIVNGHMKTIEKLEDVTKEQGNKINTLLERPATGTKSFEDFIISDIAPKIQDLRQSGKFMEFSASQLKAAGVQTISSSVSGMTSPPSSPYAPGIGGPELELFDIIRNPNYILGQVDIGRTNQSRLAWINETGEEGAPAEVTEGQEKPLVSNTFQVEMSTARKIAAHYELTEEFEDDLPQLATRVRRMLEERVIRAWDDALQVAVQGVATPYSMPGLAGSIPFANYWDALMAMDTQVRINNFMTNTMGINPQTNLMMQADKNVEGTYLLPPFREYIQRLLVQANKVPVDNAFVGDLKQYKVDIYKEFVIKVGWINDQFVKNMFSIVGEIRYHRYISDNRKKAIVLGNLGNVRASIDGGSGS